MLKFFIFIFFVNECRNKISLANCEIIFTANNMSFLEISKQSLITSKGSQIQLQCKSTDSSRNLTLTHSNGTEINRSIRRNISFTLDRISCGDMGSYYCRDGNKTKRLDIGIRKCRLQLCPNRKASLSIRAAFGENKTLVLCVVALGLDNATFKIDQHPVSPSINNDKYIVSIMRKGRTQFNYLVYITIRNITFQDMGKRQLVIRTEHGSKLIYPFSIQSKYKFIVCNNNNKLLLLVLNKDRSKESISNSFDGFKYIHLQGHKSSVNYKRKKRIAVNYLNDTTRNNFNACRTFNCKLVDIYKKKLRQSVGAVKVTCITEKNVRCQVGQDARFTLNIHHPNRTVKIIKIFKSVVPRLNNGSGKYYYDLTKSGTVIVVIRNVTSDECSNTLYKVRLVLNDTNKVRKRNIRVRLIRRKEPTVYTTKNIFFTANKVSSPNNTVALIAEYGSRISLMCRSKDKSHNLTISNSNRTILSHSNNTFSSFRIDMISCRDQGTYYCRAKDGESRINIGVTQCPLTLCSETYKEIKIAYNSTVVQLCIVSADPKSQRLLIVKDESLTESSVHSNSTWLMDRDNFTVNILSLRFLNQTHLDKDYLYVKFHDKVISQIKVVKDISKENGKIPLIAILLSIFVIITFFICFTVRKTFGNNLSKYRDKRFRFFLLGLRTKNETLNGETESQKLESDANLSVDNVTCKKQRYENITDDNVYTLLGGLKMQGRDKALQTSVLRNREQKRTQNQVKNENEDFHRVEVAPKKCNMYRHTNIPVYSNVLSDPKNNRKHTKYPGDKMYFNVHILNESRPNYYNVESMHIPKKASQSNTESVYTDKPRLYKITAKEMIQQSNVSKRKSAYTNVACYEDYGQYIGGDIDANRQRPDLSLCDGRYQNKDGLIYGTLTHDNTSHPKPERRKEMNRSETTFPILAEEEPVIYAEIDFIKSMKTPEERDSLI